MATASGGQHTAVHVGDLGLSSQDQQTMLQMQQQVMAHAGSASSRGASRASSTGLVMMDMSSLQRLDYHFARVLDQIRQQQEYVMGQSEAATAVLEQQGQASEADVDAAMAMLDWCDSELDKFDEEFGRLRHLRDVVKGLRRHQAEIEHELSQTSSTSSRHHGGHSSHRHGHSHGHSSSRHRR